MNPCATIRLEAKCFENAEAYRPAFVDAGEKSVAKITESNRIAGMVIGFSSKCWIMVVLLSGN
jgi:hypothetical protein